MKCRKTGMPVQTMPERKLSLPLNLQFFAEGDGNGTGGSAGNEDGAGENGGSAGAGQKLSFVDFLKGEGNQAEFDHHMNKAIETAVKMRRKNGVF